MRLFKASTQLCISHKGAESALRHIIEGDNKDGQQCWPKCWSLRDAASNWLHGGLCTTDNIWASSSSQLPTHRNVHFFSPDSTNLTIRTPRETMSKALQNPCTQHAPLSPLHFGSAIPFLSFKCLEAAAGGHVPSPSQGRT